MGVKPNRRARRAQRSVIQRTHSTGKWGPWRELPIPDGFRAKYPACSECSRFMVNGIYSVQVYELETDWGQIDHLLIRRHDEQPERRWAAMQRIKNELGGPDRVAIEVYPAQGDLVDQANLYHLWVLPTGFSLPFGLERPGGGMK